MQRRADLSEHIQRFKPYGNPLNSSHFDAPNTKFAPTGYRRARQPHFTALSRAEFPIQLVQLVGRGASVCRHNNSL